MYKETLRAIAGIGIFPVVSLVLFFIVFTVMLVRVVRMDRSTTEHLAGLPLDPAEPLAAIGQEACR
jgi:cytochrome c oxidase cbb3-type subunit 3